ncbi:DsbA family protein [Bartonella sp. DGB2]|uniref:DsbA family protein n=1 Tax=Bartonella sp. DGB2 TaxID=3388426 RepID=UPI00398FB3E0
MIAYLLSRKGFGLRSFHCALISLWIALTPAHSQNISSKPIETLKQELLADKDFLNTLKNKISNKQDDSHIRSVVKAYLLENPEILYEVQEAFEKKQQNQLKLIQSAFIRAAHQQIFQSSNDTVLGNPQGKTTIVEFFDYNCSFCKRAYPDLQTLIKENPDLRVVLKDFPVLGPDSTKAHIVARAFKQQLPAKFALFHQKLLTNPGRATEAKAISIALSLGANEKKLRAAMADPQISAPFSVNRQIAYQLAIDGTPAYIINEKVIMGAVDKGTLQKILNNQ